MDIYFAPMEGMTPPLLRTLHNEFFGGCDKYFTPFISTNENYSLNQKEKKDIDPELNKGLNLVPQIISNSAEQSAGYIMNISGKYGYKEINDEEFELVDIEDDDEFEKVSAAFSELEIEEI